MMLTTVYNPSATARSSGTSGFTNGRRPPHGPFSYAL